MKRALLARYATLFASPSSEPMAFQNGMLPLVSRTFALTIPQLPSELQPVVINAYLLCRMADTIEDEPTISAEDNHNIGLAFLDVVQGKTPIQPFADNTFQRLSDATPDAERKLFLHFPKILHITGKFNQPQQDAVFRCIKIMLAGMAQYHAIARADGLPSLVSLQHYCYCAAGVVGEMLTDLFLEYEPAIACDRHTLYAQSRSFGQGLQLTNILKDLWEDHNRGICWLPKDVLARHGVDRSSLSRDQNDPVLAAVINELIDLAHASLLDGLDYALSFTGPKLRGIRRFCLWTIGLALLTLRNIRSSPGFSSASEIKTSHTAVAGLITLECMVGGNDALVRRLFSSFPAAPAASAVAKRRNHGG
ncbi:phytoene/squalene synthase family protein [Serratia odorifera]|uniref:phytoene/squalene synthase family protein n=1 Tax=Serratia odorifera TaxID=618 RepID=UPI003531EE07